LIPYFEQPHLGPIHLFGVLVACGILLGSKILQRRAASYGLDAAQVSGFISWILVGGFAGGHLADRLVYFPGETMKQPLSLLFFWQGISSFGGFFGGTVGGLLYFRKHVKPGDGWRIADAFAYAFPFAWIFGRFGCFSAFDHPGRPTTLFLGQRYWDGVVRHNLGLEEALYSIVIAAIFSVLGRKPRFVGFYLGLFLVLYAPFRFALDYLRIIDVRYFHLTPGQYGCVALFVIGLSILRVRSRVELSAKAV
jgi:phosphatidylglycerol:prolipoprotein diacylglycerol transferase